MYDFIVGVDYRVRGLGAELERYFRTLNTSNEYVIEALAGLPLPTKRRDLIDQADYLLNELLRYPARYYVTLSTASILVPGPLGTSPMPMAALTAADGQGVVLFDCFEPIAHWVPVCQRNYSKYRSFDLLDLVGTVVHGLLTSTLQTA